MIKSFFSFFIFYCFCFGNAPLFSIQDSIYKESSMYDFYGMASWNRASKEQKNKMVDDFLIRESAYILGKKDMLNLSASFKEKAYNKHRQLLVNYVYQLDVSSMGRDSSRFDEGKKHLKEDLLVHHILFGYDGSALREPVGRLEEEAYALCGEVLDTLTLEGFEGAALLYSDDGSAKRNKGRLGWVSWGSTVSSFESPVFNSPLNTIIGPIKTEFGYHLAYIEDKRPSSFSFLGNQEYLDAVLLRSSSKDAGVLRSLSSKYDSLVLDGGNLVFNDSLISVIYNSINKNILNKTLNKNDVVSVLKESYYPGVVCVFNNKGLGLNWFINGLSFYNPSNRPNIQSLESLYSIFKTLLLQETAYQKGVSLSYDLRDGFKKQLLSFEKDLLYTLYFKNLVNSVSSPDSLSVKNYYLKNKDVSYVVPKSLKLEELNVGSFALADSLLGLYIDGASFSSLKEKYSLKKDFVGPVEENFKGGFLNYFFNDGATEGFVGDVVDNLDGTFSLYRIHKVYPRSYIPFEKAYSRISSLINRENQEIKKQEAISNFYKELNIVKKDTLL